ncbi:hypothetical protein F9L07_22860 [Pimelobacter simplex]|uniref:Uncharacterized protein n=1 Tax=Nocardioides simplex TaxID=2045 RepID=A0A7J5DT77_NOCSI|nr:hypothetical protein [Pimelobacter simplex]KAB2808358.1 hypothetical protein F9L07_22860 [Pimelobacter simplex]
MSTADDDAPDDHENGPAPVLDLDALEELTDERAAALERTAQSASNAVARAVLPEAFESVKAARALTTGVMTPELLASTKRMTELLARSALPSTLDMKRWTEVLAGIQASTTIKAALEDSAFGHTNTLLKSQLAETIGRSASERAAFSVTSGLSIADSMTSTFKNLMTETSGIGLIGRADLVESLGQTTKVLSAANFDMAPYKSLAGGFNKALATQIDVSSIRAAIGQTETARRMAEGILDSNIGRARSLAMQQLVATSGIADLIGSDKMMASWRQSLLSEATARSLIGTIALPSANPDLLRDIVGINAATARVVGRYAEQNRALMLAPAHSARPTRELRALLAGLSATPDLNELTFASRASRGVAGIAAADLMMSDGVIDNEAAELLEAEIVDPWLTGPEATRDALFSRLEGLDPHVPDLLRGAWAQVVEGGPAATSMASHAVQEAIDRTLRAAAPNELVLKLFLAGHLPKNAVYEKDGERMPTRSGRIAAALHERNPTQAKVVAAQAKALSASVSYLCENLQSGKHASTGSVGLVRTWLVSVEATLTQLLYEPGDR